MSEQVLESKAGLWKTIGADPARNFAKANVSIGYDSEATEIVLATGKGSILPDPETEGAFNLVWWNWSDYKDPADDPNVEIVRCTARTSDTLTIVRAQEDTAASNHNEANKTYRVVLSWTRKMRDDMITLVQGLEPENLSGQCDGSNQVFATLNNIGQVQWISLNGGILIEGLNFTKSGNKEITLTLGFAPESGEELYIKYTKKL